MIYELWDVRSNNILDAFDSRDETIDALRVAVRQHGELAVEFVILLEDDPAAPAKSVVGIGSELLPLIRDAA
jgi:hypothetical protein